MSFPLSVLDLTPIPSGGTGAQAIHNTLDLAGYAERLGFSRYWLAEHHNMSGLAAVAPEMLIGIIAQRTRRIRVGSGGILLPNYAPLKVAETFRTLEALAPGRIDLGIGRAPKMDRRSALALRGSEAALNAADDIDKQIGELEAYAEIAPFPAGHPLSDVVASPEGVTLPPIWLLGSGQLSGQIAAARGRGFAAAYHFSPTESESAIRAYKTAFRPSTHLSKPYAIVTVSVICADSDELAEGLVRANDLATLRRLNGEKGSVPSIAEARDYTFTAADLEKIDPFKPVYGNPERVHCELTDIVTRLNADELMITTVTGDHRLRRRSFDLVANAFGLLSHKHNPARIGQNGSGAQYEIQYESFTRSIARNHHDAVSVKEK